MRSSSETSGQGAHTPGLADMEERTMAAPVTCDQCEALLPGYALFVLEMAEAAAVAEHLYACERCRASLAAYEAVCDRLAQAVLPHEPPADLQQRLLAAGTDTPPPAARVVVSEPAPAGAAPESLPARHESSLPAGGRRR